eukprot:1984932-Pleurochrysis_carterae.AAC.1
MGPNLSTTILEAPAASAPGAARSYTSDSPLEPPAATAPFALVHEEAPPPDMYMHAALPTSGSALQSAQLHEPAETAAQFPVLSCAIPRVMEQTASRAGPPSSTLNAAAVEVAVEEAMEAARADVAAAAPAPAPAPAPAVLVDTSSAVPMPESEA